MKCIISPAVKEDVVYYSDFSGKCFGLYEPEVSIRVNFNYGSSKDGCFFDLHLTEEESKELLRQIKLKLTDTTKDKLDYYFNENS